MALLLKAREAAELLNVSIPTLYAYSREGLIPAPVRLNGSTRWSRPVLERWAQDGCPSPSTPETQLIEE